MQKYYLVYETVSYKFDDKILFLLHINKAYLKKKKFIINRIKWHCIEQYSHK